MTTEPAAVDFAAGSCNSAAAIAMKSPCLVGAPVYIVQHQHDRAPVPRLVRPRALDERVNGRVNLVLAVRAGPAAKYRLQQRTRMLHFVAGGCTSLALACWPEPDRAVLGANN